MIKKIKLKVEKLDLHTLEVVKKSSSSLIVKVSGMAVGLLISIYLGRTIGAEGLGVINLSNSIASLVIIVTLFGFDNVIVKNVAISYHKRQWKVVNDNIYTAKYFNGVLSIVVALIGVLSASFLSNKVFNNPELEIPLIIAMVMVVPQTFSRVFSSGLNGLRKIWQSNLVNQALSLWIVGLGIVISFFLKINVTVVNVLLLYLIARIIVSFSVFIYWKKYFSYAGIKSFCLPSMLKNALPLLLVSGTAVIASNADAFMLGWLSNVKEVGLYTVAARLALLVILFLQVTNSAISPKLASLISDKEFEQVSILVKRVTLGLGFIAVIFLIVFIFFGDFFLGLWGQEFKEAYWVLVILSIGQFVNIVTGCAGVLLIMSGFEREHGYISFLSLIINLCLNFFLIKYYGAIGAAIATSVTIMFENLVKVLVVKNKIGILTIPF